MENMRFQCHTNSAARWIETRLVSVYHVPSSPENSGGFDREPAKERPRSSRTQEVLYGEFENTPDSELEDTAEDLLRLGVSNMINAQEQHEKLYAHESNNLLLAKLPELDDGDAGALYLASETQEGVALALYGEEAITPEINDPNSQGLDKLPLTARLGAISPEEQVKQITGLLETEGIDPTEHQANIASTITDGGAVIVEVAGVPIVCGKGAERDGHRSDKIYFVSHDRTQSGFVDGGGGNGGISTGTASGSNPKEKTKSVPSNDSGHHDNGEIYKAKTKQDLAFGFTNVSAQNSLRIERKQSADHGVKSALMAASVAPLQPPHALRNREAKPSNKDYDFHYSKAEQAVISSLMSDPAVTKKVINIADGSPTFLKAVLDLMAFRYGPHTEDALLVDDGDDRMKTLFAAMKTHFETNPHAREIADHLWKTELIHMQPSAKNPEDKKLRGKLAQLRLEDCLNPVDWRDMASARRKKELPMITLYNHFPELRSEKKEKTLEV